MADYARVEMELVRSTGLRSEIERKCRGAKGEVAGVEGVELEYARL